MDSSGCSGMLGDARGCSGMLGTFNDSIVDEVVDSNGQFRFKHVGQIPFDSLVQLHVGGAQRFERRRQRRVAFHGHVIVERPLQIRNHLDQVSVGAPL